MERCRALMDSMHSAHNRGYVLLSHGSHACFDDSAARFESFSSTGRALTTSGAGGLPSRVLTLGQVLLLIAVNLSRRDFRFTGWRVQYPKRGSVVRPTRTSGLY